MEPVLTAQLSVSIVTYAPDLAQLENTLQSLATAIEAARASGRLESAVIDLVDNGPGKAWTESLHDIARGLGARVISGHGNVGYGRGHNFSLLASGATFHLVLNPDVIVDADAISEALDFMARHPPVVILAPAVMGADGSRQFLCKRYPTVFDLALRGFSPAWLKRCFDRRLAHYEMRDLPVDRPTIDVPLLSGSFMFCRREPVAAIGGFSDAFFVYFEDFDLSLRAAAAGPLAFVPQVKAVHFGGHAARKGWRHILLFVRGACAFFNRHGWKWL